MYSRFHFVHCFLTLYMTDWLIMCFWKHSPLKTVNWFEKLLL